MDLKRMAAIVAGALICLVVSLAGFPAHAQEVGVQLENLPDLVTLRGGGTLRGTIVESQPGQYLVIRLASGELRRIEGSEILSAGPAAPPAAPETPVAPQGRQSLVSVNAAPARLQLFATEPGITFHYRSGMSTAVAYGPGGAAFGVGASYDRICTAPCEATLPSGTYNLALALPDGMPIETEVPVSITGPSRLDGSYTSRRGLRIAGWLTWLGGTLAGGTIGLVGVLNQESCNDYAGCTEFAPDWTLAAVGGGLILSSMIVGIILTTRPDTVDIQVSPQT